MMINSRQAVATKGEHLGNPVVGAAILLAMAWLPGAGQTANIDMNFTGTATAQAPGTLMASGTGAIIPFGAATVTIAGNESINLQVSADIIIKLSTGDTLNAVFLAPDNGPPELDGNFVIAGGTGVFAGYSGSVPLRLVSGAASTDNNGVSTFPFTMLGSGAITKGGTPTSPPAVQNLTPVWGVACSDPVTVNNGNLNQLEVDLAASSRGPGLVVARSYNSLLAAKDGPLGFGWTHNYAMSLADSGSMVTFTNETGAGYVFALQNGVYSHPPGLSYSLAKDTQGYTLRSRHGMQWRFDTKGVLQSITDRNQNSLQVSYDTAGRLLRVTDALGRLLSFSYDVNGHVTLITDFSGRKVQYTYDAAGNLTSWTDAAGNTTQYVWYTGQPQAHLLKTVTKPRGNSTSYEYDSSGRVSRVTDSAGRAMSFQYMPSSNQTVFADPRGFAGSYFYDSNGNITRTVKTDGSTVLSTYTSDGRLASRTDENGNATGYTYDAQGNVTSVTDGTGAVIRLTYEPTFNQIASITDARGSITTFQYDAHGNRTHTARPLSVDLRSTYDAFGQVLTSTDAEGNITKYTYDSSGNAVSVVDPLGNSTKFGYDSLRRLTSFVDGLGGASKLEWDAIDRVVHSVNPLGNSAARTFDGNGNVATFTDENGRATSFGYDALDNLGQVKDAKGGTAQFGYAAPSCGCAADADLMSSKDAAGISTALGYDFAERLTQSTDSAGNAVQFVYNKRGDLVAAADANGVRISYEYDADRRLVHIVYPDGSDARFAYDANGNMTSASNANTTLSFTYDALNRPTQVTDSRFNTMIRYTYDRNGRRLSRSDPGGPTAYSYDADGRLASVLGPSGAGVQISYDALNRPVGLSYSNGISGQLQYDAAGRLTSIQYPGVSTASASFKKRRDAAPGLSFVYTYDKAGNLTSASDSGGAHSYAYDELDRLVAATHPDSSEAYVYDAGGNRLSSATASDYTYDATGRLLTAEGAAFAYDNNGNLVSRTDANGTTSYTYNYDEQLTGITFSDGSTAAYLYDPLGRRIQKSVNGVVTNYIYDGLNLLLELDASGVVLARYVHARGFDQPLLMERGGQPYFYHRDQIGSVTALTDSGANTVCAYVYDSFGRTQPCAAVVNPYGYVGRELDAESGLVYMRARYYDPGTGRFLSGDPLDITGMILARRDFQSAASAFRSSQRLNRYSYAVNNPLRFRDPTGLQCTDNGPQPLQLEDPVAGYSVGVDPNSGDHVVVDKTGKVVVRATYIQQYPTSDGHSITDVFLDRWHHPVAAEVYNGPSPGWNFDQASLAQLFNRLEGGPESGLSDPGYSEAPLYNAILDYLDPLNERFPRLPVQQPLP